MKPFANIKKSIQNLLVKQRENEDNAIFDIDEDGKTFFKEDVIADVLEKLEERRRERLPLEHQWTLNANFLIGNQYCEINPYRGDVEQTEETNDWEGREAFNMIAPLIETRIANLKKINYSMRVKPATNELSDYEKADVSTKILQHTQRTTDFESKKNTMIHWNELCGNCFWLSWWDKDKGERLASETIIKIDVNGAEKTKEQAFYQGELDYGLLTPYEIFPESIFKQGIENQRSIILEQVKSVDEIFDLYDIKVDGSNIETFELTPVPVAGGLGTEHTINAIRRRTARNSEKVITYLERPSKHRPDGLMIILVGNDKLVYYGELPYSKIPIVQVVCHETPGQFFGKSTIESLIPLQREYNHCVNKIHDFIARVALGNWMVEEGSIVNIDELEENGIQPGGFVIYKQDSRVPINVPYSSLPSEIMQERYNLKSDMEYVAGVSQLMVTGNTPSGVTSGAAISNLMEIDNTRLSLTGDHVRNSVRKLAILWLEIYKKYATTLRVVNYVGTNDIGRAISWSANDINSYDVDYITENELLMSEDMQKQRFFDAYNMGLFTDKEGRIPERVKLRALEFMKIGSYSDIMNLNSLQIQAAQRENVFFENGVIPKISDFDEHEIHIEEHLRYVLQMDFQILKHKKPEYAAAFEAHLKEHKAIQSQEEQQKIAAQIQGITPIV